MPRDHRQKYIPQNRPERQTTRSARAAESLNRPDAPPLGWRRVFTQAAHDLYGTKDVQDAITASYVWMADQIGHITLGLVPTLLLGWIWLIICDNAGLGRGWQIGGCIVVTLAIFGYWISKEKQDYDDTKRRAGPHFPFDHSDILWNVHTALLYFGIGGLLALAPLIKWWLLPIVIGVVLWPAFAVALWWLRRKLAFQQAGLPYLYRLANFTGGIKKEAAEVVQGVANLMDRPVLLWNVIALKDQVPKAPEPSHQHLLIAGPLRSGKTSLAVGIGTEFAFTLGIGRYMSAAKLMELETGPRDFHKQSPVDMEYDDGRILWPPVECDLLIVDDVDGGLPTAQVRGLSAVRPFEFEAALKAGDGEAPLHVMADKRTVWVLGNTENTEEWRGVIAGLMGISPEKIMTIELKAAPEQKEPPPPPGNTRRIVGFGAGGLGLLGLLLSAWWWNGETRWAAFKPLDPAAAFADGSFGLELAPLKYILAASQLSKPSLQLGDTPWTARFGFLDRAPGTQKTTCAADAPANLPVGFSVANRLPGNATPVPVQFVGLTCAACHATTVVPNGAPIMGAGTQTADVIAFTDAFLDAVIDTGPQALSGRRIVDAYDKLNEKNNCPGESSGITGWIDRQLEIFLIDQWLSGARSTARLNASKYDLPFHGAAIGDPDNIPTGPSRTRPFRSVVRNTLDLPGAANRAYSKVPLAAMQGQKPWSQFDGSIGNSVLRSLIAVYTSGASIAGLAEPQIADNVRKAADYTLTLGQAPPLPMLAKTFPSLLAPSEASLTRGKAVYDAHCAGCHGGPTAAGWTLPFKGDEPPIEDVGTDGARLHFRYNDMLPPALATFMPARALDKAVRAAADKDREGRFGDLNVQREEMDKQIKAAEGISDVAVADWWREAKKRLERLARQYPTGHPLADYGPKELALRTGFLKASIAYTWLRAPYLHNASVPTLSALIGLTPRPAKFCRGVKPNYDPEAIGIRVVPPDANGKCTGDTPFLFDTSQYGNGNGGHLYPAAGAVDADGLRGLLDYLGTL